MPLLAKRLRHYHLLSKKKKIEKETNKQTEEFLKQNGKHLKGLHIRHKVPGGDRNTLN